MTDIFHYFNFLPDDIIKEHIFPKLSPEILVWLTKETLKPAKCDTKTEEKYTNLPLILVK